MERHHEYWIEEATGGIWAVELGDDGGVESCYGPLLLREIDPELLEAYDYSPGGAAWIEEHRQRFAPFVPEIPYIAPT